MNIADLPDDSDTSDEDYDPGKKSEEAVSEVDSDGDPEGPLSDSESPKRRGQKRNKLIKKSSKKRKHESENSTETEESTPTKELTEEEKKKVADDLWADFMKDTGFKGKSDSNKNENDIKKTPTDKPKESKPTDKVKVTQIFEFAGEEVKVEKEVPVNSAQARLLADSNGKNIKTKKGGLGGIGSVLNQLGRKQKISTLEKSKLDWDKYKKEANLEEELQTHNKGKDGYLERQDFLQRADLRRFEIEKEVRNIERSKRMNMGNPF